MGVPKLQDIACRCEEGVARQSNLLISRRLLRPSGLAMTYILFSMLDTLQNIKN
jgi:hypothetical protein